MKRTTSAAIAVALATPYLLLSLPAKAVSDTNVTFGSSTPASGSTVQGVITGSVTAATALSLQSFSLSLQSTDPATQLNPNPRSIESRTYNATDLKSSDTIHFSWDTRSLSSFTPRNGIYSLAATARSFSPLGETATAGSDFAQNIRVNNPPVAPSGVNMTMQGEVPHIAWAPNPEPDLTGYQVQRSADSGSYETIATTQQTAFDDTSAPKGTNLRYRIVASRYSPVTASGILSPASAETAVVYIAPPPAPATAPAPSPAAEPANSPAKTAEAPVQPSIIMPAPVAPRVAAVEETVMAQVSTAPEEEPQIRKRFLGADSFSRTIAYPAGTPEPASSQDSMPAIIGRKVATAITSAVSSVPKPRYLAVALMMLVLALHVSRAARRLTAQRA